MLEALVFDVDGTLAETEELHRRAFNDAFADAGLGWHWGSSAYQALLKTTGGKERILRYAFEIGADPAFIPVASLHREKTARYAALIAAGSIVPRPGIVDLIAEAQTNGVRLAIATTTSLPNVEILCGVIFGKPAADIFEVIVAGDMVAAKKPAPDVYLLALHQLDLVAHQAVALEDSLNGLRAAKAAGLVCCISPSTYTHDEDFRIADLKIAEYSDLGGLGALRDLLG